MNPFSKKAPLLLLAASITLLVIVAVAVTLNGSHDSHQKNQDVVFTQGMIPHHQGAVDLALLARVRAQRPEVKALAQQIIQDQNQEIAFLNDALIRLGGKAGDHGQDHSMNGDMGMPSPERMMELSGGKNFDRLFLESMITHHQAALGMAQDQLRLGKDEQLQELAQQIIKSQTAEIEQMEAWLQQWYGVRAGLDQKSEQ